MTPEDIVLAGELALGLLDREERADATRRALAEPAFAVAVEHWRSELAALAVDVCAIEPPAALAARVARAIAFDGRRAPAGARGWRWTAVAASAVAAALVATIAFDRGAVRPAPMPRASAPVLLAAALDPAAAGGKPNAAIYDAVSGRVRLTAAVTTPPGRSAELWSIGGDGVPHALGVLRGVGARAITVEVGDRARVVSGATLAISIEPAGGAPGAAPTGPVIATGALARV